MNKQDIAIIICLLFIAGSGGFLYLKLHPVSFGSSGKTEGVSIKIKQQKRPSGAVVTPQSIQNKGESDDSLFNRLAADPNAKKVNLTDVIGSNTTGTVYMLRENGKLFLTIKAHMPDAPEGGYFQAWLMKETTRKLYVPLGKLKSVGASTFISNTSLDADYPDFNTAIITLEKVDDKVPERFVMQGTIQ